MRTTPIAQSLQICYAIYKNIFMNPAHEQATPFVKSQTAYQPFWQPLLFSSLTTYFMINETKQLFSGV